MGLFGKDKKADNTIIEITDDEANEIDLGLDAASNNKTLFDNDSQQENPKSASVYGIQDAIELMRQLPNVNTEIVISVVIKTLESANIQVSEIISDAEKRESLIETRSVELSSKIQQLDTQITELNNEITNLKSDFEETTNVKSLLEAALEQSEPTSESVEPESISVDVEESIATENESDASENAESENEDTKKKGKKSKVDDDAPIITANNMSLLDEPS